uniref:Uncharacterized protein n=1 Tax=Psilocybe cubensis TaxID=181762 RepID=A0A8H7XWX4_PSICU
MLTTQTFVTLSSQSLPKHAESSITRAFKASMIISSPVVRTILILKTYLYIFCLRCSVYLVLNPCLS